MQPLRNDDVAARLNAHQLSVDAATATRLTAFLNLLEQWNRVHNLTGIRDRAELVDRHLVESLALAPFIAGPRVADIGSGGGLPGIPLAILLPGIAFTLIESRRKRISFLRQVAASLPLANVEVAHGRVETLDLPAFATVLARAVAPPAELLELATPLVAPGGRLVLLTSDERGREIVRLAASDRASDPASDTAGYAAIDATTGVPGLKSRIVVLERKRS